MDTAPYPVSDPPVITFTTDFGLSDPYVAEMKAAVLKRCPTARLIDVTHLIPPQEVAPAAIILSRVISAFDRGAIHVVVVDPGVGTARRILVVEVAQQRIICPDNGLITWMQHHHPVERIIELTWRPEELSATFHGRDVMAPAAAMLAGCIPTDQLGREMDDPVLLDLAPAKADGAGAMVVYIDHYGNAITNIPGAVAPAGGVICNGSRIPMRRTYGEVPEGAAVAVVGSGGLVEIAIRNGSAAMLLGLRPGSPIRFATP